MTRRALVRAGALAACVGGLALAVKAAVIIAGRPQPPLLFEVATPFLVLGLLALAAATAAPPRALTVGGGLAALAGGLSGVAAILFVGGDTPVAGAFLGLGTLCLLASALTLGWTMRNDAQLRRPAAMALALGAVTVPLLLVFGALAEVLGEAALEGSTLVLGVGWTAYGVLLAVAVRPEV